MVTNERFRRPVSLDNGLDPADSRRHADAVKTAPVRLALIDNAEVIVEGLRGMLAPHHEQVEMIGAVSAMAQESLTLAERADVVLVDVDQQGAREVVTELMATSPQVRVVIFTYDADERRLFEALRLGVAGYLLKSTGAPALADHLVRAAQGEVVVDPSMASRIAERAARVGNGPSWPGVEFGLSQRESQVLDLLVNGRSNGGIASELLVGTETVKTHLRNIYRKLGVNTRAQAVATCLRKGIFPAGVAGHPLVVSTGRLEPTAEGSEETDTPIAAM